MPDNFLLEATLEEKPVSLGPGMLSHIYSVQAQGKQTLLLIDNPNFISLDAYVVDRPYKEVVNILSAALD